MSRLMGKWHMRHLAALAAAAFAVLAYEYAGEDVSAEASGAARELVFDSDALLYYAFPSNLVNGVVLDETTNGCDGVATGCSWLQFGRFNGGALEFFGNSSKVDVGTGLDFPSWSQYSVSLWFLHDGGGDMGPQYGHKMLDKTSFYHDWHLFLFPQGDTAGRIGLTMYEGGTSLGIGDDSYDYRDGEWHHVAVVRDGARGEFWVDGELVVETNAMFSVYSQSALCVGNSYSGDYYQQKGGAA